MAFNVSGVTWVFNYQLKMLILFLLIINTAHFCKGKAFLEEADNNRGKRSYGYLQNAGLHQTYDPQSNAEHWMKGNFYQPEVDGQPIYVPAVDQPGSYNEFLDAYYKAYVPARNPETVSYTYDTKNTEETITKSTSSKKDNFEYTFPTSKENEFSVDMSTSDYAESEDYNSEVVDKIISTKLKEKPVAVNKISTGSLKKPQRPKTKPIDNKYNQPVLVDKGGMKYESPIPKEMDFSVEMSTQDYDLEYEDYDGPNIVDKTIATELDEEKQDMTSELKEQGFEEKIAHESLKKSEVTKSEKTNQYDMPVVVKTKQKPKSEKVKDSYKSTGASKINYKNKVTIKNVSDRGNVKYVSPLSKENEFSIEMSPSDDSEDYDDPEIIEKTVVAERGEQSGMTSELESKEKIEKPVIRESLAYGPTKSKPKDDQYGIPVVKAVKQRPKKNNPKISSSKNPSTPKTTYKTTAKGSDKTSVKYESLASKQSEFSVEISPSDLEALDYGDSDVIDEAFVTELNNEKLDMTSELENKDEIESVSRKSLKESELSKTKPEGDNQYDMPIVVKTKQKSKTNNRKKTTLKPNAQKTKPQLESDYEKQIETVKTKPNKKPKETASAQKYGDQPSRGTLKSKGKCRKRCSKPNSETGKADKENFDSNTIKEDPDKLSNSPIETHNVVKTKPVKTKESVVTNQYSQYESVTKVNVISNSKGKPTMTENSKPVLKDNPQYQLISNKEKETLKSDSKKKLQGTLKYDTDELEKKDNLVKKLNSHDKDSSESDINTGNTDDLQANESDLGFLDVSESESSEKLNPESTTIGSDLNLESSNSGVLMKPESIATNVDFRGLTSMNSNIWSMLFNPNAEQNKLKLKRCITRSNETGFCTYIQNCEVPHIATSLEQLLNNACVIDDIFIGVCCPEFPVQTVKVQWDQTPSDFDSSVEDEFGHIAEDCGIRSNEASELQSWPWKAPLVSMSNGKIFCGGVVVSEDHVLTAAHCTTKIPKNQILVRLGQYDDESGDDYAVVEIKRHAQYNPRTMQNDIALLKLGRRIMNDAHIGIVCLPDEEHQNNHNGEIATLLGWRGIFGTKSRDPEFLRVISNKECENKLGMKVPSTSLCTETRKESERTCNADSGAPLVIEDDGRYEVIGILSWNRNDCDQRFPSTFSRVSSYAAWIKNHIG